MNRTVFVPVVHVFKAFMNRLLLATLAMGFAVGAAADGIAQYLKPGHPDVYTVVKGDTLWGISGRFLERPCRWVPRTTRSLSVARLASSAAGRHEDALDLLQTEVRGSMENHVPPPRLSGQLLPSF